MSREREGRSARSWWLLLGAVVLAVVALELVEKLTGPGSAPSRDGPASTGGATPARSPSRPVLRKTEDGAIEIRHDLFRRTTIRLDSDAEADAVFDCLRRGFEETFVDGTEDWTARRIRDETRRIQNKCVAPVVDIPVPPLPETPGR